MALQSRLAVGLALGSTVTLAWGTTYYLPAVLAGSMARDLGLTTTWIFGVFSAALLISATVAPAVGRHIDAHGGSRVMAASNLLAAAGLATLGLAQGLGGLAVAWLLLGLAMGCGLYDAAFATLTALYGRSARAVITGITLPGALASTICWPISAAIDAELGWRAACFIWATAHLLLGLPLNLLIARPAEPATRAAAGSAPVADSPATRRLMLLLAIVFAAGWFVTGSMAAHLPRLLEAAGTGAGAAIAAAALVGPAQLAARLAEFGLLRRAHPLIAARIAASTHPVGALVFTLAGGGPLAAAAFALIHGAGNGLLTIAKGTLPLAIFGPVGYGWRSGVIGAPARAAQALAPLLFGAVLDNAGPGIALLVSSGAGLVAVTGLLLVKLAAVRTPETTARTA